MVNHTRSASLASALALAGALGACGPSADRYELLRPDAGPPDPSVLEKDAGAVNVIEDDPLEDWDMTDAGPLSGVFALEIEAHANVIIDLDWRQLYRVRILQHGQTLRVKTQLCRIGLPSVEGIAELTIPLALEMLLRAKPLEVEGDFLSDAAAVGATFDHPPFLNVVGAALDDPSADPLPTKSSPSTAVDEDDDGHTGVTLAASTLTCNTPQELYVALRGGMTLAGTVQDLDTLAGAADPRLDQSILGYSDPCLDAAVSIPVTILGDNTFTARRTSAALDVNDNGNVTCGEIVVAAPKLFGAFWGAAN
ncbi:MAG: hypothetical protein IT373_11770 [Polyangiaceae bacterium]|nr:hypothetical protein [Polyangiaceae bacterium]